jgi:hypothetical protein
VYETKTRVAPNDAAGLAGVSRLASRCSALRLRAEIQTAPVHRPRRGFRFRRNAAGSPARGVQKLARLVHLIVLGFCRRQRRGVAIHPPSLREARRYRVRRDAPCRPMDHRQVPRSHRFHSGLVPQGDGIQTAPVPRTRARWQSIHDGEARRQAVPTPENSTFGPERIAATLAWRCQYSRPTAHPVAGR